MMTDLVGRIAALSREKLILLARELETRLRGEPVAIIGMGCRFPRGDDPEMYWSMLRDGVDAVGEVPADRWDRDVLYHADVEAPGKTYGRWGGFLPQVDRFDAGFFGISPREAESLDPQQRLLLEVTWEALEEGGLAADRFAGSRTAVYVGMSSNDYGHLMFRDLAQITGYSGTGNTFSTASGRLSYFLDLRGPNMTIDTACSSSLVALHQACESLRHHECDAALVGGVNIMLAPIAPIFFAKSRMLSPTGHCRSFDASADGFVRGEGCGVVVLKRLSDAKTAGDHIRARIRGTAVNHDGRSSGLTAPNGPAHQLVIRAALAAAGVQPRDVSYVEAHGTGSSLGDAIEIEALGAVYGGEERVALGSGKTNIGHLEAASGMAALVKVLLSLQHQEIPPNLHLRELNPHIRFDELPVVIPTARTPWPSTERHRLAGIHSFGFGGTNAHVIIEDRVPDDSPRERADASARLVTLSAKSPAALEQAADRLAAHLRARKDQQLGDVAFTLNTGRVHFGYRMAVVASTTEELAQLLAERQRLVRGEVAKRPPRVGFVFGGAGSPVAGLGRMLHDQQPRFRSALERCTKLLEERLGSPLLEAMMGDQPTEDVGRSEPALFALQYALGELLLSWGVEPHVLIGKGVGEYAAACLAGIISCEEAATLVARRALPDVSGLVEAAQRVEHRKPTRKCVSLTGADTASAAGHLPSLAKIPAADLQASGCDLLVAVGPAAGITSGGVPTTAECILTLEREGDELRRLFEAAACLHVHGVPLDWASFESDHNGQRVSLPTYPFERRQCWYSGSPRGSVWSTAAAGAPSPIEARESLLARQVMAARPDQQRALLISYLEEQFARVQADTSVGLQLDRALIDQGLDSMAAMELRNIVAAELGIAVPLTAFFAGDTVEDLISKVLDQLRADGSGADTTTAGTSMSAEQAGQLLERIDQLSADEVVSLLAQLEAEQKSER